MKQIPCFIAVLLLLCSASAGHAQLYGEKPDYKKPALYLKAGPQDQSAKIQDHQLRPRPGKIGPAPPRTPPRLI